MSESRGLHQSLPQSAQFISRLYPECIYLPQNILRPNFTMKTYKTECGRGRIGPENYSLLFREKVARVEFVWNNISPCMGEYNEHMMGFACRVYCISLRN